MFPRVPDFAGLLVDQCAVVVDALDALVEFTERGVGEPGGRVRELEKVGDRRRVRTLDTLRRAFATPFDREAIYAASTAIDDIVNYAKTTVRGVEALAVEPDGTMRDMAHELREGAVALREGFIRLRDDDLVAAEAAARSVHKAERNVEKLYRAAVAEALSPQPYLAALAEEGGNGVARAFADLLAALRRREVYRHLSNAADRLDTAGRALHDIVVGKV